MFNEIHAGKFHNLSNLRLVLAAVTLGSALFAHRFWIVRTFHSHGQTIGEEPTAFRAEGDLFFLNAFKVESGE